ncbi:MAG: 3-deoxy-7-phosphoheptulonate synthase [Myxococcota bacterium]|jgi:3-deoxy-7-phosphoheptulonate synthase
MQSPTDDVRIDQLRPLIPPACLIEEIPMPDAGVEFVAASRRAAAEIVKGDDDRLLVVCGPCSIHDAGAARDYARLLKVCADRFAEDLFIVMRVYFEKPRTTVGWKGLINDPHLDGSFQINQGLRQARKLLCDLTELQVPAGCEFLDTITPQFVGDLVSWGAIGARTTESQVHRELASGLSCPVGFKNGTSGSVQIAVDAVRAASSPHHFLSVTKQGIAAIVRTRGNDACHVILRGGKSGPNFGAEAVGEAVSMLGSAQRSESLMVDCSHANSGKNHKNQPGVASAIAARVADGDRSVFGLMLESHLVGGRQTYTPGEPLVYGQSITDACMAWEDTVPVLETLAKAVTARRKRVAAA